MLKLVAVIVTFTLPMVAFVGPARADGPGDVLTMVNTLRGAGNVAFLTTDATLTSVAQRWANHMASTGSLTHDPNLATEAASGWTKLGENIGDGYSLTSVFNALAGTTAGRANLVDPAYNRTGIGVATDAHGQVWVAEEFGAYPPPPTPTLVFPTAGMVVFPAPQSFRWSQTPGAVYYCITVGSSLGGTDFFNSGLLPSSQLSAAIPALSGGQPLWARIYAYTQGTWTWADVKFSAAGPSTAAFTRPTPGATNLDTTKPFTWSPASTATAYLLSIGTTTGAVDVLNTGILPASQTSYTVSNLPVGKTLWARIYSFIGGSWIHFNDVSFTAAPR